MKTNQQEIIDAILFLANEYDIKGYKELIKKNYNLPSLIRLIVYDLFLRGFNLYDCNEDSYTAYNLLRIYALELAIEGFVNFEN